MHTTEQILRDEAITIIEKNKAVEYVKNKADKMVEDSWNEVDKLLYTSEGKEKLKAFAEFLIKRNI
jgi:geranylgeranyl pyrophosphate synthase